jgi:hypothetical protein
MYKYLFVALVLAAPVYGQDQPVDPRAAAGCGPADIKFDVKTDKKQHTVTPPAPGKARVYVIEEYKSDPHYQTIGHMTTRVGLDGNWVGANYQGSYLFFEVEPGDHRVCSDVQSRFASWQKMSERQTSRQKQGRRITTASLSLMSKEHSRSCG